MKNFMKIKKALSMLLTIILIMGIMGVSGAGAVAESIEENETISRKSGFEMFNDYIASLDYELAELILNDEELVSTMQQDKYWYPDMPLMQPMSAVTLPLSSYQNGSFYTSNGSACSFCHSYYDTNGVTKRSCTWDKPSSISSTGTCYYLYGGTWYTGNCKRYTGTNSIQCKAFADFVYKQYTGQDVSSSNYYSALLNITNDTTGSNRISSFFSQFKVGGNVRGTLRNGTPHSFIVSTKTSTGITVYDANYTSSTSEYCIVKNYDMTWAQLAAAYSNFSSAWYT